MSRFNHVRAQSLGEEDGVVKPDMREIHTGHIPKPQFATVSGALEMQRQPQRAQLQTVEQITPRKHQAILWEPPRMEYTQHYSRVENRFNDLDKELNYDPEEEARISAFQRMRAERVLRGAGLFRRPLTNSGRFF